MDGVSMEGKEEEDRELCLKFTTLWKIILAHCPCVIFINVLQSK